jgi:glutamyl-tRNA synthetase
MSITRLAPSPTGALHLGNARTFLINWLLARQSGWRVLLRVDDLDGPRVKPGSAAAMLDELSWLGLDWDERPFWQSMRGSKYQAAVEDLLNRGLAYPCICSRAEAAAAASAPHAEDGSSIYPNTCRGRYASMEEARIQSGRAPAVRFRVETTALEFNDRFRGRQHFNPAIQLGDFVIQKSDGTAAYQLATVLDDAESGVTNIVRGDDLLDSTPRQILLYQAMGQSAKIPDYCHLPLVIGADGRRLAKRHGDTRLSAYRANGVPAGRILALLASWSGVDAGPLVPSARELLGTFALDRVPKGPIIFRGEDDMWLKGSTATAPPGQSGN